MKIVEKGKARRVSLIREFVPQPTPIRRPCPKCDGRRYVDGKRCDRCEGSGRV